MSRSFLTAGALFCALALSSACDTPPATDLMAPDGGSLLIEDGNTIDSNVFLLPPIGDSHATIRLDEQTPTRVEVCALTDGRVDLESYGPGDWIALEETLVDIQGCPGTTVTFQEEIVLNPGEHYQLNLKTDAEDYDRAFRVTVQTLVADLDLGVKWEAKAQFNLALFENSSAINVPDNWIGETAGQNFPVKYVVEWQESDSFAVEVDCDGGTFVGITAGVSVWGDTFEGCSGGEVTIVLVQEPVDLDPLTNEVCLPVGWEQDGPCYRWQLYSFDGTTYTPYEGIIPEDKPLTVAYCLDPGAELYEEQWGGYKTPAPYDTYVTPTINTESGFDYLLDCPLDAEATGLAGVLRRVRRFFGLDPQPLYAAHRGFGELVGGTLSHFGRAKAQTVEKTSGDGQSGLINNALSEPLVVQALMIPHQEAVLQADSSYVTVTGDPLPAEGENVTFEVVDGGGTLTGASGSGSTVTVETGAGGYAQVTWTLGPDVSPPDQTVRAFGDGFGTLVDDRFVADTVWFTATAYDVVTDFLEPLDEKDGYSGGPYTGSAPYVMIDCRAPMDPSDPALVADCDAFSAEYHEAGIKITEDNGRWFYQVNWKPRSTGVEAGIYGVQVALAGGLVVGETVDIMVEKGGKVELVNGALQINPTTDLPIKFTLSRLTP